MFESEALELLKLFGSQGVLGIITYILYRRYDVSEKEKNELAKEVIAIILKYEHKTEADIKDNEAIKAELREIKNAIYGRNK